MDMSETIAAKSDQLDYQNFLGGSQVVTVTEVRKGPSAEQPIEIMTDEFERPWRPALSMRRVMVAAWGKDSQAYIGRRIELFGDATVKWAGAAVGGIRIASLSHIDKPLTVALTVTRGKRAPFTVQPLKEQSPPPPRITREQWEQIAAQFTDTDPLAWAVEQLGRPLDGPQEINADEAVRLLETLNNKENNS